VPQIALRLEELFLETGFEAGVFQTLLIDSSQIDGVISHPTVQVITLIGSEKAGMAVAGSAGKAIKKTIMELGGNDPMIVFADADLGKVVDGVLASRLRNCGQSCNAAKRYIVHKDVEQDFIARVKTKLEGLTIGNPFEPDTDLGPVATNKARDEIIEQINQTISVGATLEYGGTSIEGTGSFMVPAILSGVTPGMTCFDNEVFGPVVSVSTFETTEEALALANNSKYGLGASIWTANTELAMLLIPQIEAGNVHVNGIVRGDPKMPFGGVKLSGYGREFGEYGIKEFVNIKSVVVK
jgi:succinate-semialdehyde dehydrogenase / glutarate-semialdehyde dehydrogenase